MANITVTIGLVAVVLVYVFVGNYAGKKVSTIEDYYVSGRNANTLLITGTIVASALSTNAFLGDCGFTYDGWYMINVYYVMWMGLGHSYGTVYYGRYIRRSKALTVADYFKLRFSSRRVQIMVAIVAIIACLSYLLAVTQGINLVLSQLTGLDYKACLVITWAVYTSFVVYSGSRGVILTDTMMFLLFFVVSLIIFPVIVVNGVGEFDVQEMFRQLAVFGDRPGVASFCGYLDPTWIDVPWQLVFWATTVGGAWGLAMMVSPWQAGRYLMAKNEHTVLRAGAWSSFLVFFVQGIVYTAAVAMLLVKSDITPSENVMIWAALNIMPTILGVLLLSGIVSAGLSSASTFLSVIGFSVVKDIMGREDRGKEGLKLNRIVMLTAGVLVLIVAFFMPLNVFWITIFAGTTIAGSIFVASILSVWYKKFTESAAFWSIVVGLVLTCGVKLMSSFGIMSLPAWFDSCFLGLIGGGIAAVVISRMTKVTPENDEFRRALHVVPEEEKDIAAMKKTMNHGYYLIAAGIVIMLILLFFWAIPYNQGLAG